MKFLLLLLALVLVPSVLSTELGVNYYHETMMRNGYTYIYRTDSQITQDLTSIKSISKNVKLYMNPYSVGNLELTSKVNSKAKQLGLYTVVVMNTEDRLLSSSNWADYSSKVVAASKVFNGKADEFVVGNEISLHSSMSKSDIKIKVESLVNTCKQFFNGPVGYEAFWYEKDAWSGYQGKLYFNLYENVASFTTNLKEMRTKFPTANVGEWGEDLYDESAYKDESWQKTEIQKRYDILKSNNAPVVYVFTYKEPSYSGFGLVRSDDSKRPAWTVFNSSVPAVPTTTTTQPPTQSIITLPNGGCANYAKSGTIVKICDKGSTYEMYLQTYSGTDYCYKTYCVGKLTGFQRWNK